MTTKTHPLRGARPLGLTATAGAAFAATLLIAGPAASASSSASVAGDTLTIEATSNADRLSLRLAAGQPGTLEVDFNDDGTADQSFDRSTFSRIEVYLRSGRDEFRVDQVNGAFADEILVVDGGGGSDTMNGGDGAEVFLGDSGDDFVDGNRGDDTGFMGSGADTFRWDPGDGSDVVEGQSGIDTLDFNGAGANENMSLSPNGGRSLFLRDVANIRMDMDDVEQLDLTALGGTDTMRVDDMSGTDFRLARVDLSGPAGGPDGAADVVTVNATNGRDRMEIDTDDGPEVEVEGLRTETRIAGSEVADQLLVNTLDGDDSVEVEDDVNTLITLTLDLGAGQR